MSHLKVHRVDRPWRYSLDIARGQEAGCIEKERICLRTFVMDIGGFAYRDPGAKVVDESGINRCQ